MLWTLSLSFFRRHPAQLVLALVGIAAGIAVVTGVALLRGALVESLDAASAELAGDRAAVVTARSGELAVARYVELARTPGAPDLVPVLRLEARVSDGPAAGARLELIGLDPFSAVPIVADAAPGGALSAAGEQPAVLADRATLAWLGVETGDALTLIIDGRQETVAIGGSLAGRAGLDRRLLIDIAALQRLAGSRGVLTELLAPAASRAWLQRHIGADLIVTGADQRRASARKLTAGMRANLTAMSLLALATGLFVVFSVLSFLGVQRRRSFGLLRALGLTHRQLAGLLLGEVLVIALLGGLLGLVAGTVLAEELLALVAAPVSEVYGRLPPAAVRPGAGLYTLIALAGMAASALVTIPLVREALAVPPGRIVRGVRPRGLLPRRAVLAGAVGVIGAGLGWIALSPGLIAGLGGLFLVLAGLLPLVPMAAFGALDRLGRGLGGGLAGRALRLLQASRHRLAPAISALSLALALAIGMGMMILGFRGAVADWVERLLRADVYVSLDRGALAPAQFEAVAALPGIRDLSSVRRRALADGTALTAYELSVEAFDGFELLAGERDAAWAAFRTGQGVVISEPLARRRGLAPGDRLTLATERAGTVTLPVVAVVRDYSSERGFIGVARSALAAWFDDDRRDSLGLYLEHGSSPDDIRAALDTLAFAGRLQVVTPVEVRERSLAVFDRTFRISWALALLVGLIALVALTSALLAQGLERSREYATLRALGLEPARLMQLVTLQSGGLAALALAAALPLAGIIHVALTGVVQPRAFGWTLPVSLPPLAPAAWVVPLALVAGTLTGLYPGWRIVRRPVIDHLRAGR